MFKMPNTEDGRRDMLRMMGLSYQANHPDVYTNPGRIQEFLTNYEQNYNRTFTNGLGRTLGQTANGLGWPGMTESDKQRSIQTMAPKIEAGVKSLKTWIDMFGPMIEKGYVDKGALERLQGLAKSAEQFVPGVSKQIDSEFKKYGIGVQAVSNEDLIGQVTGSNETFNLPSQTTTTDPQTTPKISAENQAGIDDLQAKIDSGQYSDQQVRTMQSQINQLRGGDPLQTMGFGTTDPTGGTTGTTGGTGATDGTGTDGSTGATGATGDTSQQQASSQQDLSAALEFINNSGLDDGTKAMFREVLRNWDPDSEVNIENVLQTFTDLKENTISPYFAEQAKVFTDELTRSRDYMEGERSRELESEEMKSTEDFRGARENLEGRGMTFSGEAGRLLGAESAYTPEGQTGSIPTQAFGEGVIPQTQRLMTTTSAARYKKNLEDMARQAETTLGSAASSGLIPGVQELGNIKGSMPRQQAQQEGQTLTSLYNQAQQNTEANQYQKVFK